MSKIKILVSIVTLALITLVMVITQERRLHTAYLANITKAVEAERQNWRQVLIDQDFAHYDGKTGKWLLYTKEEFLMDHQIALASVSMNELFPLPGPELPVTVPVSPIRSKKK